MTLTPPPRVVVLRKKNKLLATTTATCVKKTDVIQLNTQLWNINDIQVIAQFSSNKK